ncbi:MAG: gluconate 2-dehydrogenase subunit 3 family protein [Burkholderia sp.]
MSLPRYPGYDVLAKRDTPSWDDKTREVVAQRLNPPPEPRFFDPAEWSAAAALCACIVPRRTVPLALLLDEKLVAGVGDGYRDARLPAMPDAWRIGLAALDAESRSRHDLPFADLAPADRQRLLEAMQAGQLDHAAWQGMPCALFFSLRVLHDICGAYYSHPHAWSEIGFGGPANPRGYVRLIENRRDPWEAAESRPGLEAKADRENRRVR